jgi:VWFA-related protein
MRSVLVLVLIAQMLSAQSTDDVTFRSSTNLVTVNVLVRGKDGKPIEGLKKEDFLVTENGKPQMLSVLEFQQLGMEPLGSVSVQEEPAAPNAGMAGSKRFRDRRLLVLYFDFSGMSIAEQMRTQQAAQQFIRDKLTASDLVSILSFASSLRTDLEFTADRQQMLDTIQKFRVGETGLPDAASVLSADPLNTETETSATAESTELDLFNTDRKLSALQTAVRNLAAIPEKKAFLYFSNGAGGSGAENQAQLRSTINAAVRANVSFYPIDVRGLVALAPGASAATAGPTGHGLYTGSTQQGQRTTQISEQDTLLALASDTGGKALIDNNDLTVGMVQAQLDLQSYYTLGFYSSNEKRDGKLRQIEVKLTGNLQTKLDFRSGYYADKDWNSSSSSDKERQLEEALLLGDPKTDLPIALEVNWFRLNSTRYFVPVALKIPGSALPLHRKGDQDTTQFDFIAQIRDSRKRIAGNVRDALKIKLPTEKSEQLKRRNILYDTGFTLAPGTYTIKFLARENSSGKIGTFETTFHIPDRPELSSVVWSSQKEPLKDALVNVEKNKKVLANHPLIHDGYKLVPSVSRLFRSDGNVYVYLEAYDPQSGPAPSIAATVSLFQGKKKVYESEPVMTHNLAANREGAAPVQLQLSFGKVPPGRYTAQVSVLDQLGQKFLWNRTELTLVP